MIAYLSTLETPVERGWIHLGFGDIQLYQGGNETHLRRNGSRELVSIEFDINQFFHSAELRRDSSEEVVSSNLTCIKLFIRPSCVGIVRVVFIEGQPFQLGQ